MDPYHLDTYQIVRAIGSICFVQEIPEENGHNRLRNEYKLHTDKIGKGNQDSPTGMPAGNPGCSMKQNCGRSVALYLRPMEADTINHASHTA